jgi:formate dehydrogenase subunit gamma
MPRPADTSLAEPELARFGRPARWVHGLVALLMLVCLGTAAVLYVSALAILVGHRQVVELVHVWSGFALPVPLLVGLVAPSYRAELRRLDRFTRHDWRWLRSSTRRDGSIPVGKYNAGQKLNGALSAGAIAVLLLTGTVMYVTGLAPLAWRTGATLTHDWSALAVGLLVLGHLSFALRDPIAMRSLRTGTVPRQWARHEHSAWVDELTTTGVAPPGRATPRRRSP